MYADALIAAMAASAVAVTICLKALTLMSPAEKIPGTFLNKPELTNNGSSLGQHFLSNLLY